MYRDIARLILYRDLGENSILKKLSGIFEDFDQGRGTPAELTTRIYEQMKALLDLATQYGFDKNLWHNYLTFVLLTNENSFSMTSEKVGANDGTVNHFARGDFAVFKKLFAFDFGPIEKALSIDCFSTVLNYRSIQKKERMYNKNVSQKVQMVSEQLEKAADEEEMFRIVTDFYAAYGVGM
ncbi:MAG: AAA family ATPase, partial [Lachnospiraceae bacterium]|nr:AAA family ATPase [Lachnospiraceae bacterium]